MKYFTTFLLLILVGCKSAKKLNEPFNYNDPDAYNVYKIDSTGNYYLIYARKGGTQFKIISKKEVVTKGYRILINGNYPFNLHTILNKFKIGDKTFDPINLEVSGFGLDKETTISFDKDCVRDLFHSYNIKGLYFVNIKISADSIAHEQNKPWFEY